MMRIALLSQYYKPEMGAPQNRLHEMVTGLRENGCEISVITGMPNYPTGRIMAPYRNRFSSREWLDDIEVRRFWLYPSNSKKALPRIVSMFSFSLTALFSIGFLRRKKIDFLIVESPPLLLALSGYLLSRLSGAKLICNISDVWPLSAKEMGAISEGSIYRGLERVEQFVYKKSIFCMGQSEEIVNHMKHHGSKQTYLFRNGVDPARFMGVKPDLQPEKDRFIIVYAGLLGFAQGILGLCKAIDFKTLGVEFHIYGAGGEQEDLVQFLKNNPERGIFFHGAVTREDIPAVLSRARVTLIPLVKSIYGAVPSKIYESMAAGVPILFSGDGEGARIITDNNLGWVSPPSDYQRLKRNIQLIVGQSIEIEAKHLRCREAAENQFNRPKQIKELYRYLQTFHS